MIRLVEWGKIIVLHMPHALNAFTPVGAHRAAYIFYSV